MNSNIIEDIQQKIINEIIDKIDKQKQKYTSWSELCVIEDIRRLILESSS